MPPVRKRLPLRIGTFAILGIILAMLYSACATMPPLFVGLDPATPTVAPATNTPTLPSPTNTPTNVPATEPPTVEPTAVSTDTPIPEAAAETEVAETPVDDEDGAEIEASDGMPRTFPHKVAGREECTQCHEVEAGQEPSPASHAGWSDSVCLVCHIPADGSVTALPLPEKASPDFCLSCHGPYDQLIALTTGYTIGAGMRGEGLAANPHSYVPHESANIIECKSCHTVHPLPVLSLDEIKTPNTNYCFAACHHEDTFEPCSDCHNE